MRELCNILGIKQNTSTVYHPCTDRQSERTIQWLEQYLCFWTNEHQDNWVAYLPIAEFNHNNWPNETMHESPFFLLMGYNLCADWTDHPSPIPQVALHLDQFKQARKHAEELMIKAQKSWVRNKDMPKYKVGDQVWLEGCHLCTNQPTMKLAPRRHGPFKIVQVMSPVNYRLELPTQWSIHPVFHIDLLTPYQETPTHGPNYQCPPLDLVDGEEEYEVKRILDSQQFGRRCKLQYLVKWKGYPDSENQWVDKDDIFADKALQEFKSLNPASEVHIRHLHIPGDHIITLTDKYMTSPTPSTIDNAIPLLNDTQDYPISHIFSQLIEPEHGQVSPKFIEYQDEGAAGESRMKEDGQGVEEGTDLAGQMPVHAPVHIPSTSNISDVLCAHNHNQTKDYCHNCNNDDITPVFILPPAFTRTILGVIHASQAASAAGAGPLTGYDLSTSAEEDKDSNKENHQDAMTVLCHSQDAQGVDAHEGGGDSGQNYGLMEETEDSPV